MSPDLGVVVPKSDASEAHQSEHRDPHVWIRKIRPQQRRHHDRDDDQDSAHGRRARFLLVRLRPVFPDVLADLKFAQLGDQPRPQRQAQEQRRQCRERGAKRGVLEYAKGREVAKQLFVEQPIEHLIGPCEEPLQGMLDVAASRTLEQNRVARLRDPPQVFSCRGGIGEKERGVYRQTCFPGCVD